jgi:hypothetical protein
MAIVGKLYELQQGIKDPRDGEIIWTSFDQYPSVAEAKKEAKNKRGRWLILEMKIAWQSECP